MNRERADVEVSVIGASLAGTAAAIELARCGARVALFDRHSFPRRKACGEGLSRIALPYLEQLGVGGIIAHVAASPFYGYRFMSPNDKQNRSRECILRSNSLRGWGISRGSLDTALIERAMEYGDITIYQQQAVRDAAWHNDSWLITTETKRIRSKFIVLATGSSPQAFLRSYVSSHANPSNRVGLTFIAQPKVRLNNDLVTVIPFDNGEIYLTPLTREEINVSAVGTTEFIQRLRISDNLSRLISETLGEGATLAPISAGAGHFSASSVSRHPNLYLAGDALESFDPSCGMGMTHAISTGLAAARSIYSALSQQLSLSQAAKTYAVRHAQAANGIRRYSKLVFNFIATYRRFPAVVSQLAPPLAGLGLCAIDQLTKPGLNFNYPRHPAAISAPALQRD